MLDTPTAISYRSNTILLSLVANQRTKQPKETTSNATDRASNSTQTTCNSTAIPSAIRNNGDLNAQLSLHHTIHKSIHIDVLRSRPDDLGALLDGTADACVGFRSVTYSILGHEERD